jgi:hypothetical protein
MKAPKSHRTKNQLPKTSRTTGTRGFGASKGIPKGKIGSIEQVGKGKGRVRTTTAMPEPLRKKIKGAT